MDLPRQAPAAWRPRCPRHSQQRASSMPSRVVLHTRHYPWSPGSCVDAPRAPSLAVEDRPPGEVVRGARRIRLLRAFFRPGSPHPHGWLDAGSPHPPWFAAAAPLHAELAHGRHQGRPRSMPILAAVLAACAPAAARTKPCA